jgi:acetyl-CoA decarbonylase/synthase complex subunit gamma
MEAAGKAKPLLYAADEDNWKDVLELAKRYDSPLAVYSSDLSSLGNIVKKISSTGFKKIVLDPGIASGAAVASSLERYSMLRKAAVSGSKDLAYPLLASTASLWSGPRCEKDPEKCAYMESTYASALIMRYASFLIMNTTEPWAVLPVLTLRAGIYADPRVEPTVEAKLYSIGSPDKDSPVFLTTNFALTYYSVSKDLEDANASCYLLVVDTDGLAASVAVAADKLTPAGVNEALKKSAVAGMVAHRTLIIPGVAAGLRAAVAKETGWSVLTGPQDSSQLAGFLKDYRHA